MSERGKLGGRGNKKLGATSAPSFSHPSRRGAAKEAKVSEYKVRQVRELEKKASPEVLDRIRSGETTIREEKTVIRRAERIERTVALAAPGPFPGDRKYPVLLVDPPWKYEYIETDNRAIENQYPTMSLDQLRRYEDVPKAALEDAVLFMWVTNPKLAEALELLKPWGFEYRTNMVWVKDQIGMGYYARAQHELLFIAKRGNLPVPEPSNRPSSVIEAPRKKHSAKPVIVYELIERMYPDLPKVEFFARGPARKGWFQWGNQAEAAHA
jgi:N6-adenosine-specific RNA methylase IME4